MDTAETTSIACTIGALDAREQARRRDLAARMRAATRQMRELPDGYAFRYPVDLYLAIAEFIALERRCCPFFRFVLEVEPDGGPLWLRLTGRPGVKAFIQTELGLGLESGGAGA